MLRSPQTVGTVYGITVLGQAYTFYSKTDRVRARGKTSNYFVKKSLLAITSYGEGL